MAVAPGVLLASRYRVQKIVGRGATGTVYQAHDVLLDQPVALKILNDDAARRGSLRSFRGEVGLSRRVSHPNVCRVHEYVEHESARFLVRELVQGRDLRALLRKRGPLAPELACDIALELARGLGAIHAAGLVHRRLSARHVLCDATPRVRIAGLRRARRLGTAPRKRRRPQGPVEYMSPEEARGQEVDGRSDLYSLGVLLFEMITGAPPFHGATPVLTRLQQIHEPPPLRGPRATRVPLRLVAFLEKALAKDPADRFGSAEELADALRTAARPVVPMEVGALPWAMPEDLLDEPLVRPLLSRSALRAVTAFAATGLVVAGTWWVARPRALPPSRQTAAVARPASPFVPAAIESPPADAFELLPLTVEESVPPPAPPQAPVPSPAAPTSRAGAPPRRASAPVRPVRLEPARSAALPPLESVAPAMMETSRVVEEPVAPEVVEVVPQNDAPGRLQIGVRPWAVVQVDGRSLGETPLAPLDLSPGVYTARIEHPDFQPLVRRVTVQAGETVRLQVDLAQDGVAR